MYQQTGFFPLNEEFEKWGAKTYVQDNFEYYGDHWARMGPLYGRLVPNWNWSAFFLAPYWLFYRKMFGYGFAYYGIYFGLNFIMQFTLLMFILANNIYYEFEFLFLLLPWLSRLIVTTLVGFFGNALYCRKTYHEFKKAMMYGPNQASARLSSRGGTSNWGLGSFFIAEVLGILLMIFGGYFN